MAEVVLDKVSKHFSDGIEIVKNISLTIKDGEFFILVGPSGCGKSTLLNMIVGLESVTEGEIRVNNKVINTLDPKDRNMAMVFQSYALYPHMTVRENMAFPLKLAKKPKEEITQKVEQTAATLGLTKLLEHKPAHLSGGQRQRVAMGRAIVRQPQAFLMDEPLSNLDAKLRLQMRTEIAQLQKHLGITTLYVTHDQSEAMTLGDRVAVLHQGEVQQIAPPRELYSFPRNLFVADFIGSPAMNFIPAKLNHRRLILPIVEFDLPPNLKSRLPNRHDHLLAGIRPEHLQAVIHVGKDKELSPPFEATVDAIEWMGADVYAHFEIPGEMLPLSPAYQAKGLDMKISTGGGNRLIARLNSDNPVNVGERLAMQLDIHKLHLFDSETGENIIS